MARWFKKAEVSAVMGVAVLGLLAALGFAPCAFCATASRSLSPLNRDFGAVQPGSPEAPATTVFTLTNTGDVDLPSPHVGLSYEMPEGVEPRLFEIDLSESDCESRLSLAVGESCHVFLTYNPLYPGPRSGTITFDDPSGQVPSATASFEGVGIGPIARLSSPLSIGSYLLNNGQAPPTVFSLGNSGNVDLEISSISLRNLGTNPNQVVIVGGSCKAGGSVAPNGSCTIQVAFTPTQAGRFSGQLRVDDNAAHGFQEVTFFGSGAVFPPEPPSARFVRIIGRPPPATTRRVARFRFAVTGGGVPFTCKLDLGPFRSCRSPIIYRHLGVGVHVFRVKPRIHAVGLWSGVAAARFRVLPKRAS